MPRRDKLDFYPLLRLARFGFAAAGLFPTDATLRIFQNASAAVLVLAEVTQAVAAWRDVALSCGLQQEDLDAMEPAFEHAETERARALTAGLLGDLA